MHLAKEAERAGFDAFYVADHPGSLPAPFVALAAACGATERIKLGTCVANAGLWEPYTLAQEVATLDLLSGGRAVLGLGAGHTPSEWTMRGMLIPPPAHRIARLVESVSAVRSLLDGETVSVDSEFFTLTDAKLEPSLHRAIPLMVGGGGPRVLRFAAATADIVGVTGLAKTLPDGHHHEADWSMSALDRVFDLIRSATPESKKQIEVEALVQHIEFTDDPQEVANRLASEIPNATEQDILSAPFMWIGSAQSIAAQLLEHERRWGINRYVVRHRVIPLAKEVLQHLRAAPSSQR
jgi:probable F420-dependent oxidoreductase